MNVSGKDYKSTGENANSTQQGPAQIMLKNLVLKEPVSNSAAYGLHSFSDDGTNCLQSWQVEAAS